MYNYTNTTIIEYIHELKYNVLTVYVMCPLITRNNVGYFIISHIKIICTVLLARETCLSVYSSCVHM